jgi:hypothetical protein
MPKDIKEAMIRTSLSSWMERLEEIVAILKRETVWFTIKLKKKGGICDY